ncbi:MAG: DNA methyltransferase [Gordonia sp. (in: high G+C Gram-positive bacteria)]|nr:MAG: DNA methyltransferase [Gordonia sp. (in: high G+C Gram-positive bacteria)]
MGKVTDDDVERVRAFVAAIPRGSVTTYGDLATAAGLSSPRIVGWIMRTDSADLPWHRVIGAGGRPAAHKAQLQLDLLADDGVPIVDGRVLLRDCRWTPELDSQRELQQLRGAAPRDDDLERMREDRRH